MDDKTEELLFLTLGVMEDIVVSLERRVRAADRFLKNSNPELYLEYRKVLRDVESEHPSTSAQSLEELRKKLFPSKA
jgi:hypothetical protein